MQKKLQLPRCRLADGKVKKSRLEAYNSKSQATDILQGMCIQIVEA